MESPQEKNERPKEICSITVVFPVGSDDAALAVKKWIGEGIKDLPDARVDFRISSMPLPGTMPMR